MLLPFGEFRENTLLFQATVTQSDDNPASFLENGQHYSDLLSFLF